MRNHRRPFHSQSRTDLRTRRYRARRCPPHHHKRKCASRRPARSDQAVGHRYRHYRDQTGNGFARAAKNRDYLMSQINTVGAELAELGLVRAATDITGYGLIGHLISLCRASGVSADINPGTVPIISSEIHELV